MSLDDVNWIFKCLRVRVECPSIRLLDIKRGRKVNALNAASRGNLILIEISMHVSFPNHFFRMNRSSECDVTAAIFVALNKEIFTILIDGNNP